MFGGEGEGTGGVPAPPTTLEGGRLRIFWKGRDGGREREGGTEGGREGEREGGRDRGREEERQIVREGGKEGRREGGKEGEREGEKKVVTKTLQKVHYPIKTMLSTTFCVRQITFDNRCHSLLVTVKLVMLTGIILKDF